MKKALAATLLAAALALPVLATSVSAADSVRAGRTIEAFTGTNLVDIQGYPANRSVTVEVLRNGVVVSTVTGRTDADGFAEFNHVGGGQVSAGGDCFKPPVSPDVMPGDMIRTKVAGEGGADRAVVRDLFLDTEATQVNTVANTITVQGHVRDVPAGAIDKAADVLELRLNADGFTWDANNGRRDLRENVAAADFNDGDADPTTFTHVFQVSDNDAANASTGNFEQAFEWSAGAAGAEEALPPAIFVSDAAEGEALVGCPPFAENAVTSGSPKIINKANVAKGLRLSGISNGATEVSVTLDDQDASTADAISLNATLRDAYVGGFQTWRTDPMTAQQIQQLRALRDGRVTASASVGGPDLSILKDTVAPARAPVASPRPGIYPRPQVVTLDSQAGTKIHYTLDGSRPNQADQVSVRPIRMASTGTIKAIAIDLAGNKSPLGSYRYVIRNR